jgi:hypothetical protein
MADKQVKIFVVFNHDYFLGKLTKFFTGCYAYHAGFVVPESDAIYDMGWLWRKIKYSGKYTDKQIVLFDLPEGVTITEQDLMDEVIRGVEEFSDNQFNNSFYGFMDYAGFLLRPIYHLFGKPTRNFGGKICTEKMNDILVAHGWKDSPFNLEVPSPCDYVRVFNLADPVEEK